VTSSEENLEIAHRVYEAIHAHDAKAAIALMAPSFRGVASDGMPDSLGGTYEGPKSMLHDCWGRVYARFDARPEPEEFIPVAPDRVIVIGRYLGTGRASGRPLSAAFVHVMRFADGHVTELIQITDTGRWRDALD
jgi:2-(1,2-epoxy-1,2-dihydrophenyl)acetyl-CoA isomerase